jgi:hypothetical protein
MAVNNKDKDLSKSSSNAYLSHGDHSPHLNLPEKNDFKSK